MKNRTLQHAFPIVAAAIGNRFGIKVSVGGDQAYTTGTAIQLPAYEGDDPDYQDFAWACWHTRQRIFAIPILRYMLAVRSYVGVYAALLNMSGSSMSWRKTFPAPG